MQKSEAKMIVNFKIKFGSPSKDGNLAMLGTHDKVIIVFSDHDKGQNNMKGLEPMLHT